MLGGVYSDQGGREYNEDYLSALKQQGMLCAVIADGLGGHGGGEVASRAAVDIVKQNFKETENKDKIEQTQFEAWFKQANEKVLSLQTAAVKMKTTLAVLCVSEKTKIASWAHLGDSRIYHFVNGKEVFCTFDHSVSRMAVLAGEINLEDVRFHRDRSKLLKVVGKEPFSLPEYGECVLDENAQHAFLLCTDGFWEYVTEAEMEQTLMRCQNPKQWIREMYMILNKRVQKENSENDNNSAIAIFV